MFKEIWQRLASGKNVSGARTERAITKDERDGWESQYRTLELDRNDWIKRYDDLNKRYLSLRHVIEDYSNPRNWEHMTGEGNVKRVWNHYTDGFFLARQWFAEHIEKEIL